MREVHLKLSPRQMMIIVSATQGAKELRSATVEMADKLRKTSVLMQLPMIDIMESLHETLERRWQKGRWERKTEYALTLKPIRAAVVIGALGNSILNANDEDDVFWKDSAQRIINEINDKLWR